MLRNFREISEKLKNESLFIVLRWTQKTTSNESASRSIRALGISSDPLFSRALRIAEDLCLCTERSVQRRVLPKQLAFTNNNTHLQLASSNNFRSFNHFFFPLHFLVRAWPRWRGCPPGRGTPRGSAPARPSPSRSRAGRPRPHAVRDVALRALRVTGAGKL